MGRKRMRIGFLTQASCRNFQAEMLAGAVSAADKLDADIIRFTLEPDFSYFKKESFPYNRLEFMSDIAGQAGSCRGSICQEIPAC